MMAVNGLYGGGEGRRRLEYLENDCSVSLGGVEYCSVQRLPNLLKILTEGAVTTKPGAYSGILQPSQKRPTLSNAGGSYLGVPCRDAL